MHADLPCCRSPECSDGQTGIAINATYCELIDSCFNTTSTERGSVCFLTRVDSLDYCQVLAPARWPCPRAAGWALLGR